MNLRRDFIGSSRKNATGFNWFAFGIARSLPNSGKSKEFTSVHLKTIRHFRFTNFLELVKSICWNQASSGLQCFPKKSLLRYRLRSRINHRWTGLTGASAWRIQAPAQQSKGPLVCVRILPDNGNRLSRGDVVTRRPGRVLFQLEMFSDVTLLGCKPVPSAHGTQFS